ncbi:MAG TPA: heat-shock protein Hsp20 [Eubacteriaceae bacterium]|nr:heat-shock protein Hsp20 [Eubacteriaceae bacterium]
MAGLVPFNRKNKDLTDLGFTDFHNMLDDFFSDNFFSNRALTRDTFKVDVQEDEKAYKIEADLPGIKKDEVEVTLDDGRLTIAVNKEENIDEEKKNYIHKERRVCSMNRSIYLADAKDDDIKAKLDDGVLSVTVPKAEKKDRGKVIEIE